MFHVIMFVAELEIRSSNKQNTQGFLETPRAL